MNCLVFRPDRERPEDLAKDPPEHAFGGAFKPESDRFIAYHRLQDSDLISVDISQDAETERRAIISAIESRPGLECLAFVCHGWKGGIQLGQFSIKPQTGGLLSLASAIGQVMAPNLCIIIYGCSTGAGDNAGDGGFADELRDRTGAQIDCHTVKGHCCSNPYVRRMERGRPGTGGAWLIEPGSDLWPAWDAAVHDRHNPRGDLRFRFPLMSRDEIRSYLMSS